MIKRSKRTMNGTRPKGGLATKSGALCPPSEVAGVEFEREVLSASDISPIEEGQHKVKMHSADTRYSTQKKMHILRGAEAYVNIPGAVKNAAED
ncbi:hypothetical protein FIBSPDRAFT_880156 [Athelia psychrophila]|uniref:Uncharacterized protein n=1 Tax=Athelia psychrophila TaxID=1759441 RepID=A0A167T768_9AGAM|nr:hypothetical protein FIBSPDRAFT_880230 [Fibularhizoctonia sp. CBS 109695]KZP02633.1 hypothetical protein FIBSPDRAFT_880156 [Fibularhizoctonia sp. CBS 109695]